MKRHLLLFALLLLISGAMFGQLAVNPATLDGFTYVYGGGPSTALNFSVSGTSLPTNVTVAAPTGFEVSLSEGGNYSSSLTLIPVEGTLIDTTIYVHMVNGLAVGDHGGEINVTCGDDFSANVILNGFVDAIGAVELPTFNPEAGTYNSVQYVNISCPTDGASIFYSTVSGNGPWIPNTGTITVNESMTIWAFASKEGYTDSPVASATYTINIPEPELNVTPTLLEGFTYVFDYGPSNSQMITVTGSNLSENATVTVTEGANSFEVCETANGTFSGTLTLQITEGALETPVYVRMKEGLSQGTHSGSLTIACNGAESITVTLNGTVNAQPTVATPTFSPTTGTYPGPLTVTINCNTENATIRYTTNGNEPTQNSSIYSAPLTIDQTVTVKAKAWKNGYQASTTASANYTITYTINTSVTPLNSGSVTGGGTYPYNTPINLLANNNEGYTFSQWQDGNVQNPRPITVTNNATYTATFSPNRYTITTNVTPENSGTVIGGGTYDYGTTIELQANPNNGYTFNRWQDGNTQNPRTIRVTGDATYTAYFTQNIYTITTNVSPEGSGTVEGGGAFHYNDHTTLTATPTPNSDYEFQSWDDGNTDNPRPITVTGNATYTALFVVHGNFVVTADVSPIGSGAVTGTGSFPEGSSTILTAIPNNGYTFNHWQDGNTDNPRTVTVNSNLSFTAYFTQINYTITTHVNPPGSGTVTGGGNNFHYGNQVTLTATANSGYTFDHWNDGSTQNPRTITVTGNAIYTAYFTQAAPTEYTITTTVIPVGSGTVTGGGTYQQGATCTLTATPNTGYEFVNWKENGNVVHGNADYTFTVNSNRELVANFQKKSFTITTKAEPADGGTITGNGTYDYGTIVNLQAYANEDEGYIFDHWDDGSTQNPRTITVTGNATYTAYFKKPKYTITVSANPANGGSVYIGDNPNSHEDTYNYGEICTVHARPNQGFVFINWTKSNGEQVSSSPDYPFHVTEALDLVANFAPEGACIIYVDIQPEESGTTTGAGIYSPGDECTLKAFAKQGYKFKNWTMNDDVVWEESTYTFYVEGQAYYVAHFEKKKYKITATANPIEGGNASVSSTGLFYYGDTCTLTARPNQNYTFENWTDNENVGVSNSLIYKFKVTSDADFTANFTPIQTPQYTISVSAYPTEWGTVYIGDSIGTTGSTFAQGQYCTVHAEAKDGYTFVRWEEDGQEVNADSIYQFKVDHNCTLVAIFDEYHCFTPEDIVVKKHKVQGNDTDSVALILIYPEDGLEYQWLRSDEENGDYTEIPGVTGQYYYKKGGLDEVYYKVRITKEGCTEVSNSKFVQNSIYSRIRIYPNPSRRGNNIVVMNDGNGPSQLSIYSTDGRLLHAQTVTDNQTTLNLNLPSGVYIAYLTDSDGYTKIGKLVIQ